MAKTEGDIRRELEQALKGRPETILGTVKKVDERALTCDIDDDGVVVYGVRLQCVTNGAAGFVVYPAVGAQALCLRIEDTDTYLLVNTSEIDKIGIADSTGKVENLLDWMSKVYNDLQSLQQLLLTAEVAGNGAPLAAVFNPQTPPVASLI